MNETMMSFSHKTLVSGHVRVETSCFETEGGVCEYHAVLHVVDATEPFEVQMRNICSAYLSLLSDLDGEASPVFRRYFLSDAANQAALLPTDEKSGPPCATSVVQQPPLDGSKIALWVYLCSGVEITAEDGGVAVGHNGLRHLWTASRSVPEGNSHAQTDVLLRTYVENLADEGCTLARDCIRTWFFVRDVDVNYKGVVEARKALFRTHGLTEQTHYITSTGIEGRTADPGASVMMDAYSVKGLQPGQQQFLLAPTHLNPTHEYGVTFERGVRVLYGDRSHIFISGTASIDNRGEIVAPGDIAAQTRRMFENIEALLAEAGASMKDIAQMIVYLRDTADYCRVEAIVRERFGHIPGVIALAPVCRPGWLIETECIAIRQEANPAFKPF